MANFFFGLQSLRINWNQPGLKKDQETNTVKRADKLIWLFVQLPYTL